MFNNYFISDSGSKRPRLEQIPAANLDADDPLDDEDVSILYRILVVKDQD